LELNLDRNATYADFLTRFIGNEILITEGEKSLYKGTLINAEHISSKLSDNIKFKRYRFC
jgi:hypothetical protein